VLGINQFFDGFPEARILFDELVSIIKSNGSIESQVTKTQFAQNCGRPFAFIWILEKHLKCKAAQLVLSIYFPERDLSPCWKEDIGSSNGKSMHHLEIHTPSGIDEQVITLLHGAWTNAGISF
jgi:hypothetical protein